MSPGAYQIHLLTISQCHLTHHTIITYHLVILTFGALLLPLGGGRERGFLLLPQGRPGGAFFGEGRGVAFLFLHHFSRRTGVIPQPFSIVPQRVNITAINTKLTAQRLLLSIYIVIGDTDDMLVHGIHNLLLGICQPLTSLLLRHSILVSTVIGKYPVQVLLMLSRCQTLQLFLLSLGECRSLLVSLMQLCLSLQLLLALQLR